VSSHYFLFEIDDARLDKDFLNFYSRTAEFMDQIGAQGSTNYAAIRPAHVLSYTIPLPALPEQRRIVARVKGLLDKVEEARVLADERDNLSQKLLHSVFHNLVKEAPTKLLSEVAPLVRRPVVLEDGITYPELGVRSFGRGTFHKPSLTALEVGDKKLFRISEDDLIFNIVFAWEGAVAVAKPQDSDRVGSHRFLTCVADAEQANVHFLNFYFQTPEGLDALEKSSPGGAGRNRTLSIKNLAALRVPVPDLQRQNYFMQLLKRVDATREERRSVEAELDALPSAILARAFAGEL